jgi:ABC-type polysaccharide/polyol phosphate export permease
MFVLLFAFGKVPEGVGLAWLPAVILVQLVFTGGLALALAALTVHFRDIRDILANVLMLWFFCTPIVYFYQQPEVVAYKTLFDLNPLSHLVLSYQEILFFEGAFGHWRWLVALGIASIGVFVAGYWLFDRLRDSFAEVV